MQLCVLQKLWFDSLCLPHCQFSNLNHQISNSYICTLEMWVTQSVYSKTESHFWSWLLLHYENDHELKKTMNTTSMTNWPWTFKDPQVKDPLEESSPKLWYTMSPYCSDIKDIHRTVFPLLHNKLLRVLGYHTVLGTQIERSHFAFQITQLIWISHFGLNHADFSQKFCRGFPSEEILRMIAI